MVIRPVQLVLGLLLLLDSRPPVPDLRRSQAGAAQISILRDAIAGRDLVEAAARRFGGQAELARIERLHVSMRGQAFNGLQGFDPANIDREVNSGGLSLDADLDFSGHRYRRRTLQTLPGQIDLDAVAYYQDGHVVTHYPKGHHVSRSNASESAVADGLLRFVPALFVQRALKNIATATLVGEYSEGIRRIALVDVSSDVTTRLRAHIAMDDGRLIAIESAVPDPLIGDDRTVYRFDGERMIDGMPFPTRVLVDRRGRAYLRIDVESVAINPPFDPGLFAIPTDEPLQATAATNPLGGGAYEITGLDGGVFRVIFFDLGDAVAVFDAPESRSRSGMVAAEIQKTLGNKPIKYLILSHFHDDHAVGVGYYVDRGVQIVTAPENASIVARYAVANSRIRPDLSSDGKRPSFLFVTGERLVLHGSGGQLDIRRLPDCPHAKGMLVAMLPSANLLVQADLFVELAGPSDASADLMRWLALPGAPQIDWIAGPHLRKTAIDRLRMR